MKLTIYSEISVFELSIVVFFKFQFNEEYNATLA